MISKFFFRNGHFFRHKRCFTKTGYKSGKCWVIWYW